MTLTDSEAREELELACQDNEIEEVLQLFASGSVNADDATAALKETDMKPSIIRILLHNGADPSAIYIRQVAFSDQAREILSLLDEFGYNFETEGHLILQSVLPTPWSEDQANPPQGFRPQPRDARLASRPWR